jgi:hypothetical protein
MDWKREATEKLRQHEAKKAAVKEIPGEIVQLESAFCGIRGSSGDGTPVKGGGSGREDALLNNIAKREELQIALDLARACVYRVESGLAVLTSEERLILDRFFIVPHKGVAERLAADLNLDVKSVYKRKDAALKKFTLAMYGCIET